MKYLLTLAICMCTALSAFARNESVSAISYNPSRLGAYSHLKAVRSAIIPGGVNWSGRVVNISSQNTVAFRDEQNAHKCTTKPCQSNINTIKNIRPENNSPVPYAGSCSSTLPCGPTEAYMPNTAIVGDYTDNIVEVASSFVYTDSLSSTFSDVYVWKGGVVKALEDSYIQNFAAGTSNGEREIDVTVENLEGLAGFYAITDFKLGNVTINPPSSGTTGYAWKALTDSDGESHKVLAVK
ncbi:MAG: hypothetical protein IKW71_02680 [Elusimicrobiaceae bacterium]|nr:hypothetical protein [Elusimicrobiaceae bacterium]